MNSVTDNLPPFNGLKLVLLNCIVKAKQKPSLCDIQGFSIVYYCKKLSIQVKTLQYVCIKRSGVGVVCIMDLIKNVDEFADHLKKVGSNFA